MLGESRRETPTIQWTQIEPRSSDYAKSGDKQWWHLKDAAFAREYAKSKPLEDFASSFASYFIRRMGSPYGPGPGADAMDGPGGKIEFLDAYFNSLAAGLPAQG